MIKKKYFLLLSTLLLTVLLGFFGTCYAKTVTQNEIRNFIYNAGVYNNKVWTESQLQTLANYDFSSWVSTIENNEGRWILSAGNPNWYQIELFSYTGNATNLSKYGVYKYPSNNRIAVNTSYLTKTVKGVSIFGDVISWYPSDMYQSNFMYTDCNIYSNAIIANGSILTAAGTYKPNTSIFDGIFRDSSFEIDINADFRNNKATISNDTSGTEYFLIPYTSGKIRIGNMFDYSNLAGVVKRKFRYKQSTRSFDLIQEYQSDTTNLEFFDIADDTLIVFEYYQPETTEFITFIPKEESGFSEFTVPIYFTTDNTRIINGVIDTGDTFSGDYYHNYNNDTNTDKVIDNANDGSEVDTILNNFTSGDLLNAGGYVERDNPFRTFILAFVYDVCNILLNPNQEDVYFDYSMHGEPPTRLYASQFTTPETPLKTFIRLSMIFGSLFIVYIQFKEVIDLISTGNAAKVLHLGDADVYFYKM